LFAIGAYVIGSATEWQAEAERASVQPLPNPAGECSTPCAPGQSAGSPAARRDHRTAGAAPHRRVRVRLDLLVQGLRSRYAREN
jgi:TetR/AcrR family tetracycline transcriptional repressor